ncbi:DNA sulfur modification protein DndB [Chitinimonas koreensis]|uniref:DNA sulfur modification protein DndB n=1 Tax=Chitinimonas koreensis TaxID=356302 RepID=UPI000A02C06F|nr:DNA sulfur modification protein DndB [Chitinimonas koreensis]QNM95442.1 DNA sulfur modification protein DndB [Chitinimonas koreensis]
MAKHYVIATCLSYTPGGHQVQQGEIVSTHAQAYHAHNKADEYNKYNHARGLKVHFGAIESEQTLAKGSVHAQLAESFMTDRFDDFATQTMKSVLHPGWRGGKPESDEEIGWALEALGLQMEQLRERYGTRAQDELEAAMVNQIELAESRARVRAVKADLAAERSQFTYSFPAVAGLQAGRAYYAAQVPYSALVKLFTFNDDDVVPAQLRAQRILNERRAEAIGDYLVENPSDYVLPAITASVSAEMSFEAVAVPGGAGRIGLLHIPMEATILINDGQHRRKGIEAALARRPSLRDETITVTIFFDQGLERSQQMFADINGKQVKPSSAINALYDRRNPFNAWVFSVLALLPDVGARVDAENSSVGVKSHKLWSLIAIKKFLSILTGVTEQNVDQVELSQLRQIDEFLVQFFAACRTHIPQWSSMVDGSVAAYDVREGFVIGHAVWLEALAVFARRAMFTGYIMSHGTPEEGIIRPEIALWERLEALAKVDPRKESLMWANRCVVLGKMQKTADGVKSTAAKLLTLANVPLTIEMRELEVRLAA